MLVFKGFVAVSLFFNCQKQDYSAGVYKIQVQVKKKTETF